jgi:hypothetical protein
MPPPRRRRRRLLLSDSPSAAGPVAVVAKGLFCRPLHEFSGGREGVEIDLGVAAEAADVAPGPFAKGVDVLGDAREVPEGVSLHLLVRGLVGEHEPHVLEPQGGQEQVRDDQDEGWGAESVKGTCERAED